MVASFIPLVSASLLCMVAGGAEPRGPLADLPSKPGEHVGRIQSLGNGQWLNLGQPAADPQWGSARGRAYTPKMAYADDLQGAFLNGQGVHGYIKQPENRVMDDTWFYDLNRHAWVCIAPGTSLASIERDWHVNDDGFLAQKDGQSPPMVGIVHGYNSIAYSPERRQFLTWHGVGYANDKIQAMWKSKFPEKAELDHYHNRWHPYLYDVETGRWSRHRTDAKQNGFRIYGATGQWLPTRGVFGLNLVANDWWLYDADKRHWEQVRPEGTGSLGGYEGVSCYDTRRHRVYLLNNQENFFGIYDVASNKWIASRDEFSPGKASGRGYHSTISMVNYDAANDVMVLFHKGEDQRGVWIYDPTAERWRTREPLDVEPRRGMHGFYSPAVNAHYFFDAGDSRTEPGNIWVWRYQATSK